MPHGSALERAFADVERMELATRAAIANPALALSPMASVASYQTGEMALDQERLLHYRNWPYVCISAIAKRVAMQPIYVSLAKRAPNASKSYKDDLLPLDNHPFLDAIHAPNPIFTKTQLIWSTVASLELCGRAFWWFPELARGESQREIWPIPPSWIHPVDNLRKSYQIRPFGAGEPFTVAGEDVAYFSLPDPSNPFGSVSPLQSQAYAVDTDESIQTAQARSFANGLFPTLAITVGDTGNNATGDAATTRVLTTDQRNVIMDALRKVMQGPGKNGNAILLDGFIKEIKKISNSPAEMDFMQSGKQIRSRIFTAYGINPIIVGEVDGANRAQAVVAEESLVINVLNPIIELLSEAMTRWVGPVYARKGERLIVWIEPARVKDHELNIKEYELGLKYGMVSRNELRTRLLGIPPAAGSDVFVIPLNCEVLPADGTMPDDEDDSDPADAEDPSNPDVKKKR
jgi:phage portal protein BeeE